VQREKGGGKGEDDEAYGGALWIGEKKSKGQGQGKKKRV